MQYIGQLYAGEKYFAEVYLYIFLYIVQYFEIIKSFYCFVLHKNVEIAMDILYKYKRKQKSTYLLSAILHPKYAIVPTHLLPFRIILVSLYIQ